MIQLVWRTVRFTRGRAVALAAGLLVAAVAFSLLTASVSVNAATIKGVVGSNWRGAYDLLVLPAGSEQTGTQKRVVQVNYLSTAADGITLAQYRRIARLPGVSVAAPLAILGYVIDDAAIPVTLTPAATGQSGARVLEVNSSYTADQGLSTYPTVDESYVYITPRPVTQNGPAQMTLPIEQGTYIGPIEKLPSGRDIIICPSGTPINAASPFATQAGLYTGACYSRIGQGPGTVQAYVNWSYPVLVAGIDPLAENELTGLGRAVTSGRYLGEDQTVTPNTKWGGINFPVIASTTSFEGTSDQVTVGLLPSSVLDTMPSDSPITIAGAIGAARGSPVMRETVTSAQAWQQLLGSLSQQDGGSGEVLADYWTAGQVAYHDQGGQLVADPVTNGYSVWKDPLPNQTQYLSIPPANADTGFRQLTAHPEMQVDGSLQGVPLFQLTGEFDPARVPGFASAESSTPLASYRTPLLTGADPASVAALHGQALQPDGNMAGYAQQPPLLYTTLAAAQAVEEHAGQLSGNYAQADAPIGSIRVRVSGLRGTVTDQLDKIAAIGQDIRNATGLEVVVTAGASQLPVTIGLPAGKFGRPPLRVSEGWTETGVALVVLHQADRESLALLVLILVVCGLFLAGAALAGVRGRRTEIGALRAMGWSRRQVFTMVLGEVAALGIVAGAAGAGLSAALISGLHLHVPVGRAALVLPVAILLALLSGLVPSWHAARIRPASALTRPARAPRSRGRRIRTVTGLAAVGIARVPGRCALAAAGLTVGVAGLTVLLAAHVSFATSIGDSELAGLVTGSIRGTDLAAVLLTIALSAVGIADVTYLNLRERAAELAALAASGWSRPQLGRLLATESVLTAVLGSVAGAAVGLAVSGYAFGLSGLVVAVAVAAAAGGTAVALIATVAVLVLSSGRPLAAVLAADE